ncbi:MAG: haloacid dehalogenase-like hydrolase [Microthrixaceae bacterium]
MIASNVVSTYAWLAGRRLGTADRARLVARLLAEAPGLLAADRSDRSDFLRSFYRRYEGAPVEQIRADAADAMSDLLLSRSFPDALRRVREHRRLGHRTVLITGALDLVVEPLAPLFDDIVCAEATTEVRNGVEVLTGHLRNAAHRRRRALRCCASSVSDTGSILRSRSPAPDSSSDLSLLEAVGFPVAVNPRTPARHDRPDARLVDRGVRHRPGLQTSAVAPRSALGPTAPASPTTGPDRAMTGPTTADAPRKRPLRGEALVFEDSPPASASPGWLRRCARVPVREQGRCATPRTSPLPR